MVWPPTTHQDVQDEIANVRIPTDYFRSGHYSTGSFWGGAVSSSTLTLGILYVRPFWVARRRAFDRIGVNVNTAATAASGGLVQVGLYAPGGIPGALLFESSAVSSETTGAKEWVITLTLDPGIYWVGARSVTATSAIPMTTSAAHGTPFVGVGTTVTSSNSSQGMTGSAASNTTAGMTSSGGFSANTNAPFVLLRAV